MTQRAIEEYFGFEVTQPYDSLYSTSDNRVYVNKEVAVKYANTLQDKLIVEWYKEYIRGNSIPVIKNRNL